MRWEYIIGYAGIIFSILTILLSSPSDLTFYIGLLDLCGFIFVFIVFYDLENEIKYAWRRLMRWVE